MRARDPSAFSAACPIARRKVVYSVPLSSVTAQRVFPFRVSLVLTAAMTTSASMPRSYPGMRVSAPADAVERVDHAEHVAAPVEVHGDQVRDVVADLLAAPDAPEELVVGVDLR